VLHTSGLLTLFALVLVLVLTLVLTAMRKEERLERIAMGLHDQR